MESKQHGIVSPKSTQERLKQMVDENGLLATVSKLGISRESIVRIIAGMGVRAGTLAIVEKKLSTDK
jgi:hypothetical protein